MRRRRGNSWRRLGEQERIELLQRVADGVTQEEAAAAVGSSRKAVQRLLIATGGLRLRMPVRSPLRLAVAEREEVSRGIVAGDSLQQIAGRIRRTASTLSREVACNGGRCACRACRAEQATSRRAQRPKPERYPQLRREVERGLLERWSPQQIAARLVCDYPDDLTMRVSHETIYRTLLRLVRAIVSLRRPPRRDCRGSNSVHPAPS
jgi:IS30 family transposase